jgi:hypothetical protein
MKTNLSRIKPALIAGFSFVIVAGVIAFVASAASFPTILGIGNMPESEFHNGPTTLTARQLLITPETPPSDNAGWHYHPGIILSVVGTPSQLNQGSVTIEDGCGGEETYAPGQAFEQIGGRVHRAKNLSGLTVEEHNMFINEQGTPITRNLPERRCGPPRNVTECKNDGWEKFDFPVSFRSQGDCIRYVQRRPRTILEIPADPLEFIPEPRVSMPGD